MAAFLNPFVGMTPGRKLNRRELSRALRLSLAAEQEAVHLYEALADAATDPLAKAVLQDVADEERVHVGEFQRLLEGVAEGESRLLHKGASEVDERRCRLLRGRRARRRCLLRLHRRAG